MVSGKLPAGPGAEESAPGGGARRKQALRLCLWGAGGTPGRPASGPPESAPPALPGLPSAEPSLLPGSLSVRHTAPRPPHPPIPLTPPHPPTPPPGLQGVAHPEDSRLDLPPCSAPVGLGQGQCLLEERRSSPTVGPRQGAPPLRGTLLPPSVWRTGTELWSRKARALQLEGPRPRRCLLHPRSWASRPRPWASLAPSTTCCSQPAWSLIAV